MRLDFVLFSLPVLFGAIAVFLLLRVRATVRRIVRGIELYQKGVQEVIPRFSPPMVLGDLHKLAETLHFMSDRLHFESQNVTEERNEKEVILKALSEGVIAVDGQMKVRTINSTGAQMVKVPRHEVMGKQLPLDDPRTPRELLAKCAEMLQVCQERRKIVADFLCMGEAKKVYIELVAVPRAQCRGAVLVLRDNSSHHKVLEMGKDFVANASHELRTPITIIKGFTETLQDLPELPRDMVADITEKIVRNCQRMDTLVKNLLTLADLENLPDSRFQSCDLVALAETCSQVTGAVYQTAQISIEKNNEAICVAADPDILELAILNLLDNAAKYSNPPAQIRIHLKETREEVRIVISDKGIGIPPADLEQIFERFYTVDKARSRRLGGAGLGLSIVRTIIEKHHGNISVTSAVGRGTSFEIKLPRA